MQKKKREIWVSSEIKKYKGLDRWIQEIKAVKETNSSQYYWKKQEDAFQLFKRQT